MTKIVISIIVGILVIVGFSSPKTENDKIDTAMIQEMLSKKQTKKQ